MTHVRAGRYPSARCLASPASELLTTTSGSADSAAQARIARASWGRYWRMFRFEHWMPQVSRVVRRRPDRARPRVAARSPWYSQPWTMRGRVRRMSRASVRMASGRAHRNLRHLDAGGAQRRDVVAARDEAHDVVLEPRPRTLRDQRRQHPLGAPHVQSSDDMEDAERASRWPLPASRRGGGGSRRRLVHPGVHLSGRFHRQRGRPPGSCRASTIWR
jgi:hypothetical protein